VRKSRTFFPGDKYTSNNKNKLKLDRGNYNHFTEFLDIDWDDYLTPSDNSVDEMWETFKIYINDHVTGCEPYAEI